MEIKDILRKLLGVPKPGAEVFDLRENLTAKVGRPIALRQPPPGNTVIEVIGADERVLAVDTFPTPPAPRSAFRAGPLGDIPFTYVRIGLTGYAHQEGELSLPLPNKSGLGFKLPSHLSNKEGGAKIRIYWSCEHA